MYLTQRLLAAAPGSRERICPRILYLAAAPTTGLVGLFADKCNASRSAPTKAPTMTARPPEHYNTERPWT